MNRNRFINIFAVCCMILGIAVALVTGMEGDNKVLVCIAILGVVVSFLGGMRVGASHDIKSEAQHTMSALENTKSVEDNEERTVKEILAEAAKKEKWAQYNKDDIYYEKNPEYIKKLEELYAEDYILYIEGKSYCIIKTPFGSYDAIKSVCPEGDVRLNNTLTCAENQFLSDNFFSIKNFSIERSDGFTEAKFIILTGNVALDCLTFYVDFYDKNDIVIDHDTQSLYTLRPNTKYELVACSFCKVNFLIIKKVTVRTLKESYTWEFI